MSATELVIGADGFVGQRLQQMSGADGTSRRNPLFLPNSYYLDLLDFKTGDLPLTEVVYLCAGVNGSLTCARNVQEAYRINVDATIKIAEHYKYSAFVVWISSTTVEWGLDHYATQKRTAETALRGLGVGIVRAGRVTRDNVDDLCNLMMKVGRAKKSGLYLWGVDEKPYAK